MTPRIPLLLAFVCLSAAPALASSSQWLPNEGGRVRLVTSGLPDAQGRLNGVLQIDLKPGWKTYWRDPGSSGVAPSIDVSANTRIASVEIAFPAPQHHFDGVSTWAGYDYPVALPVTFQMRASGVPGPIEAAVFLGVCESLCVPVQARLTVDPSVDPDNPGDAALVENAHITLPGPATAEFGAMVSEATDKAVTIEAYTSDAGEPTDFFLAGSDGYLFGTPKKVVSGDKTQFIASIITRPKQKPGGAGLHYTLSTAAGSVSGLLPYF